MVCQPKQQIAVRGRQPRPMRLMEAKPRGVGGEPLMAGQEGDGARRSAHPANISVEVAGMDHVGHLERRLYMAARAFEPHEARLRRLGQCYADLLRQRPGEGPAYLDFRTLVKHPHRIRAFEFKGLRPRRSRGHQHESANNQQESALVAARAAVRSVEQIARPQPHDHAVSPAVAPCQAWLTTIHNGPFEP